MEDKVLLSQLRVDVPSEHTARVIELLGMFATEEGIELTVQEIAPETPQFETKVPRHDLIEWITDEETQEQVAIVTKEKLIDFNVSAMGSNGTPAIRAFNTLIHSRQDAVAIARGVDFTPFFTYGITQAKIPTCGIRADMMPAFMAYLRGASRFVSNFGSASADLFAQFYAQFYVPEESVS